MRYIANTTIYEGGRTYQKGDVLVNITDERINSILNHTGANGQKIIVPENEFQGGIRETADATPTENTSSTGVDSVVENPDPTTSKTDYDTDVTVYDEPAPTPAPTNPEPKPAKPQSNEGSIQEQTKKDEPKATISVENEKAEIQDVPQNDVFGVENPEPPKVQTEAQEKAQTAENREEIAEADKVDGYPKHLGGGWYELADGTKVQGKDEAFQAMAEQKKK